MRMIFCLLLLGAAVECSAEEAKAKASPPGDYKIEIALFGVRAEPMDRVDLIVRKGQAYLFPSGSQLEVILNDPVTERLQLFDLDRKLRSEISFGKLDRFQKTLHDAIEETCAKREAEGGKGNRLAAAMSRDLIDPHFKETYDEALHQLRLTNATIEVDAKGVPDSDSARLTLIAATLDAIAKLDSVRDTQSVPPFARIEVMRKLTQERRLRPADVTYLYRLTGPPRRLRWTYRLVPSLTARELEALARVDLMRDRCKYLPFERYAKPNPKQ